MAINNNLVSNKYEWNDCVLSIFTLSFLNLSILKNNKILIIKNDKWDCWLVSIYGQSLILQIEWTNQNARNNIWGSNFKISHFLFVGHQELGYMTIYKHIKFQNLLQSSTLITFGITPNHFSFLLRLCTQEISNLTLLIILSNCCKTKECCFVCILRTLMDLRGVSKTAFL